MKKIFFYLVLFLTVGLILPSASLAAGTGTTNLTDNGATTDQFSPATWDDVVLDFNLQHKSGDSGAADILNALTLKNNGNARDLFEISAVKLWADSGLTGWQGWGFDTLLGTASFNNDAWYFSNMSVAIPASGLHLFVTIDVKNFIAAKKTVQFYIPQLVDNDGSGTFSIYDQGIFMVSGVNGPAQNFMNQKTQSIGTITIDTLAPQAIVDNLADGQTLKDVTGFTITGQARDQGRGNVASVQLGLGPENGEMIWHDVVDTGSNYSTWSYNWQEITPGTYIIKTKSRDGSNNQSLESYPWKVIVTKSETLPALLDGTLVKDTATGNYYRMLGNMKCLISSAAVFSSWGYQQSSLINLDLSKYTAGDDVKFRDGYLIKGSSSKVYVVVKGQKRWITSEAAFNFLGYQWSKINVITDAALNSYIEGTSILTATAHPDGTLVKYAGLADVYLVDNGKVRHIVDEKTFTGLGYHWDNIITISPSEAYALGDPLAL